MVDKITSEDNVCAIMGDFNIDQKVNDIIDIIDVDVISI